MPIQDMNESGNYSAGGQRMGDSAPQGGVELRLDPASVPGLKDYQPGDTVELKIRGKLNDSGDDTGMMDVEVLSAEAEPMAEGPKRTRMMKSQSKPDMSGTAMEYSENE